MEIHCPYGHTEYVELPEQQDKPMVRMFKCLKCPEGENIFGIAPHPLVDDKSRYDMP